MDYLCRGTRTSYILQLSTPIANIIPMFNAYTCFHHYTSFSLVVCIHLHFYQNIFSLYYKNHQHSQGNWFIDMYIVLESSTWTKTYLQMPKCFPLELKHKYYYRAWPPCPLWPGMALCWHSLSLQVATSNGGCILHIYLIQPSYLLQPVLGAGNVRSKPGIYMRFILVYGQSLSM